MTELAPETCARCGAAFGCGASAGACWCATVTVAPDVLRALDQQFDGCLCPACLASAEAPATVRQPPAPAAADRR